MEEELFTRFWSNVGPEDENGCWSWSGSLSTHFKQARLYYKDKTILAYRLSYEIHIGPIPKGKIIRHKCDNPSCVNPDHLEVGTQQDNIRDMIERGRAKYPPKKKGQDHTQAKLTQEQVDEIRHSKETGVQLAERFVVSTATISCIKNNKRW